MCPLFKLNYIEHQVCTCYLSTFWWPHLEPIISLHMAVYSVIFNRNKRKPTIFMKKMLLTWRSTRSISCNVEIFSMERFVYRVFFNWYSMGKFVTIGELHGNFLGSWSFVYWSLNSNKVTIIYIFFIKFDHLLLTWFFSFDTNKLYHKPSQTPLKNVSIFS